MDRTSAGTAGMRSGNSGAARGGNRAALLPLPSLATSVSAGPSWSPDIAGPLDQMEDATVAAAAAAGRLLSAWDNDDSPPSPPIVRRSQGHSGGAGDQNAAWALHWPELSH